MQVRALSEALAVNCPKGENMRVGIVGHEAKKFTIETEEKAREIIRSLLSPNDILVSGGCHLGGIDIWAEEEADKLGLEKEIHLPAIRKWEGGFKQRNLMIANTSDIVHCIVVKEYPEDYVGRIFNYCYHCKTSDHIKSGGCWTAKRAKEAQWHII
jgi:hypothetical protein